MARIFVLFLLLTLLADCAVTERRMPIEFHQKAVAALGRDLFFDPRLSADGKISCASCHKPELAFTNGEALARGVGGRRGDRNVPTLINRSGTTYQFWDMRAHSLEQQVEMVLTSNEEMGHASVARIEEVLAAESDYRESFQKIFGRPVNLSDAAVALVAFERTILSGEAPYDRFVKGDRAALTSQEQRGMDLFFNRFHCASCHSGSNFSDERLRVRCYPLTSNLSDFVAPVATSKFKTPTLRNLTYTGPYMHNGSLATLEEVVDFYSPSQAITADGQIDKSKPIVRISKKERDDVVAFLKSLSAEKPFIYAQ